MEIVLYSNGCPKCGVLKTKLNSLNISYKIIDDTKIMIEKDLDLLPVLEIDGKLHDFSQAIAFLKENV